jgi:hypothetical protein
MVYFESEDICFEPTSNHKSIALVRFIEALMNITALSKKSSEKT